MSGGNDTAVKSMISDAVDMLAQLGLPERQQNERSALTLLALLDLRPGDPWKQARNRMIGITPMMNFFNKHYGKAYASNSRETVRRQTIHQFESALLVVKNPDDPERPTNSGKTVYAIHPYALRLIQMYGTVRWKNALKEYTEARGTSLRQRYAQERDMSTIPLKTSDGRIINLSPGGQNVLVKKICEDFGCRFVPGGVLMLVGDTAKKSGYCNVDGLKKLGVHMDRHGKQPDVIIHDTRNDWLVIVEAVTSHGPINQKRRDEFEGLFAKSSAGLVYVTAFLDMKTLARYVSEISWETEVWIANSPDHVIHFNGTKLSGPHENTDNL